MKKEHSLDEQINLFNILSVADKELTHSAIIKLLIEQDNSFLKQFGISTNNLFVETEKSYKSNTNNRIRFDIIGLKKNDDDVKNISFIIENKFKVSPTVSQLEAYDDFFEKNNVTPIKILMVYFAEQIPSDVRKYCNENKWFILPYFTTKTEDSSFFKYLKKIDMSSFSCKIKFLVKEYINYLSASWSTLCEKIKDERLFLKKDFDEMDCLFDRNRDVWFRYLMHIQSLISKYINDNVKYISSNDGGARPISTIVFWLENNLYFGVDGNTVRLGAVYNHENRQIIEDIKSDFIKDPSIVTTLLNENIEFKIKQTALKPKNKKDNNSVFALISYDFNNWTNKEEFAKASGKILNNYYDYMTDRILKLQK